MQRIESCEQLVDHHQQLHVRRLLGEKSLGRLLVHLGFGQTALGLNALQQLGVGVVNDLPVGIGVGARPFLCDVLRIRIVRFDQGALVAERVF